MAIQSAAANLCAQVAYTAGFARGNLVTAVAVALAESGCRAGATGTNGPTPGCPNGSRDRGLWQINDCHHSDVGDPCAFNAQCNADAAFRISSGGTNWNPWTTFRNGRYLNFRAPAERAVYGLLRRDFNSDGSHDLLARRGDSGNLYFYFGTRSGALGGSKLLGNWSAFADIVPVGDFNRDGNADLMARRGDSGNLYLYRGTGAGGFHPGILIGNWSGFNLITGVGDWNGDGRADLIARSKSSGSLYLYRGNGGQNFSYPGVLLSSSNWKVFSHVVGAGDLNRDGHPDLLARRGDSGSLYWYRGTGGGLGAATLLGNWSSFNRIVGAGDWNHDGKIDIVSRSGASGILYLYRGNGGGGVSAAIVLHPSNWNAFNIIS